MSQQACPHGGEHDWEAIDSREDFDIPSYDELVDRGLSYGEQAVYRTYRCRKCGEEREEREEREVIWSA